MASTSETGHAKNVANFDKLIASVTAMGVQYNPSRASIKLVGLQTTATTAKTSLTNVNAAISVQKRVSAERIVSFKPLNKLITRVVNGVKSTDTSEEVDKQIREFARKIQGRRAQPKKTEEEKKAIADKTGKEVVERSSSQLSYDFRLENLDRFLKLLSGITQYNPNEPELKYTALTAVYNDLKAKNTAVINADTALNNARIARNAVLYKDNTGLVDLAQDAKTYIKSAFEAQSPQFKQVSKLSFERVLS